MYTGLVYDYNQMDFLSVFTQDLYLHLFTDTKKYCPYPSCPLLSLLTAILKLWNQPGCPQQWHNSRPPEVPEDPAYYSNNKPHPELSLSLFKWIAFGI